ncbi:MAG TPA: ABC transporter permease [Stenomitos sp.]
MAWQRIWALMSRHFYVIRRNPMRIAELVYWPLLDLLIWGFLSVYLNRFGHTGAVPNFLAFFLGALILWDLLFRAQQGVSIAYLEEVWSRNLLNLFVSPLSVGEFLAATVLISLSKLALSTVLMSIFAALFYGFNILILGWSLLPFVTALLLMGWALGIFTTAVVLRYGQGAESLAWVLAFLFQPLSAVFYPVSVLPSAMRPLALALPSAHVFEGMRAVIRTGHVPLGHLAWAFGLDVVYAAASVAFFYWNFGVVRDRGLLAKTGE